EPGAARRESAVARLPCGADRRDQPRDPGLPEERFRRPVVAGATDPEFHRRRADQQRDRRPAEREHRRGPQLCGTAVRQAERLEPGGGGEPRRAASPVYVSTLSAGWRHRRQSILNEGRQYKPNNKSQTACSLAWLFAMGAGLSPARAALLVLEGLDRVKLDGSQRRVDARRQPDDQREHNGENRQPERD